jgi:hypothetical protein
MILQRLATSLRKQDWFTVAVETLIVVLGVFLGLQVNNWNAARVMRADEADLLSRMIVEAEDARMEMADYLTLHNLILHDVKRLVVRLNDKAGCLAMDDEMKGLILEVGDFPPPRFSLASANEALETGRLSLIKSSEIRDGVREMADQMTFVDRQWQRYIRIKQDVEQAAYGAAGLSLTSEEGLQLRPGLVEVSGMDQYGILTPEGICGNTQIIALASNAAITQHLYTVYVGQVSAKLDTYAASLATYAGDGRPVSQSNVEQTP